MTVRHRTWRGKDGRVRKTWTMDFVFTRPDGTRERIRKPSPVQTTPPTFEPPLEQAVVFAAFDSGSSSVSSDGR